MIMKIGLVQYNPIWENKEANKGKLAQLISALDEEVSLLVFPEMTLTGFSMKSAELAEQADGNSFNFFSGIAKEKSCDVVAGIIELSKDEFYNSILHINNSGVLVSAYHKIHLFPCSGEDKNYKAGNKTVITRVKNFQIGLSICYDLRFPELFRIYGKGRVDLIIVIANWPIPRIDHWKTLLKARAIENQCYVAGANRVGTDPEHAYNGFSAVFDPMGKELIMIENDEKIITANICLEQVRETRDRLPFLGDVI